MPASRATQEHAMDRAKRVFQIVKSAAENGIECPTNAAIAESVGYSSTSRAADAISFLSTAGMIRVERSRNSRVVEIVATGKRTAGKITNVASYATPALDAFADHLADGKTVRESSAAMGLSYAQGRAYLNRIKARLGPQAR